MTRLQCCFSLCVVILLCGSAALCATFDERLWEKYAGIEGSSPGSQGGLAGIYLEPLQLGEAATRPPFADLRVLTDRKEEVPYQVVARRPERRNEELPAQLRNLSQTERGDTWLELLLDKPDAHVNAVEIATPDTDFSRQVEILGSNDGTSWNTLRKDGVIFDINRGEKLRRIRVSFPQTAFRLIAVKVANAGAPPLSISGAKAFQESEDPGQTYAVPGTVQRSQNNAKGESSIVVRMDSVFPLDRLEIDTPARNFQRSVQVQVRRGSGDWERWAGGTVFNFETATMHESQQGIDMPEIAAREFRLVFSDRDSPPLPVTRVTGAGYRRLLVYKRQPDRKLYLFWGNPRATPPRYDLAGLVARQNLADLPITGLGPAHQNGKFAGNAARLPFTERYKYPLYLVVTLVIAGLILLQYRVFKRVEG